ncbi:hypothetical protein PAXINDRAFT_14048 [Paxillus involutus ATCC 200175]|uniref:Unplaced genomic scaffold PAXINscaffold_33, whole genome shotgun sequence n=1 Tax=Paxillus involutus ATCC 200175 TaxID=664439 RepID=A0A0C9TC66_PAXIN|nr:hypothetical protein PAXINDRAFT_14048 [Paxillus involutus ATCC 200175]
MPGLISMVEESEALSEQAAPAGHSNFHPSALVGAPGHSRKTVALPQVLGRRSESLLSFRLSYFAAIVIEKLGCTMLENRSNVATRELGKS